MVRNKWEIWGSLRDSACKTDVTRRLQLHEVLSLIAFDDDHYSMFSIRVQQSGSASKAEAEAECLSRHVWQSTCWRHSGRSWLRRWTISRSHRSTWFSSRRIRTMDFSFPASSRGEGLLAGEEIMLDQVIGRNSCRYPASHVVEFFLQLWTKSKSSDATPWSITATMGLLLKSFSWKFIHWKTSRHQDFFDSTSTSFPRILRVGVRSGPFQSRICMRTYYLFWTPKIQFNRNGPRALHNSTLIQNILLFLEKSPCLNWTTSQKLFDSATFNHFAVLLKLKHKNFNRRKNYEQI